MQQRVYPQPGVPPHMQPGAGPFRASNNRETYRKELIAELTSKILEQTPRNDREALIQLECIVDQWKPRLEHGEQRPAARTEALHRLVEQLIDLARGHS